jgi:2-polyprenyl-6-methoxyphenol hydroxylase-like FAD-dependent oxidoreductase
MTRIVIVGAGPTGLYLATALAHRGHKITVIDRDPGPQADGSWRRRGVMQFHHPHFFRAQVVEALQAEMPQAYDDLQAAGAQPVHTVDGLVGLRSRRSTFEQILRATAHREPGITLRTGHAQQVLADRGRVTGLRIDGARIDADLVINASGRAGRLGRELRHPPQTSDCGFTYLSRQYQLHPGAGPAPMNAPFGHHDGYPGYHAIVFLHDNGVFSTTIARPSADPTLAGLRFPPAFDAATHAIPALAAWTDPHRAHPISPVMTGGRLTNSYQGQLDDHDQVGLPGLLHVGDTVCTTNPVVGRGVTTSLMQARQLLQLFDIHGGDPDRRNSATVALAFDDWCTKNIRPWFDDQTNVDTHQIRRWAGHDINLTQPMPSDLIVAVAQTEPALAATIGPYLAMRALPDSLDSLQRRAHEIYSSGWRPSVPHGPTHEELRYIANAAAERPRHTLLTSRAAPSRP